MSLKSIIKGENGPDGLEEEVEELRARVEQLEGRTSRGDSFRLFEPGEGEYEPVTVEEKHVRIGEVDGAELWREDESGTYYISSKPLREGREGYDCVLVTPADLWELAILADEDSDRVDASDGDEEADR